MRRSLANFSAHIHCPPPEMGGSATGVLITDNDRAQDCDGREWRNPGRVPTDVEIAMFRTTGLRDFKLQNRRSVTRRSGRLRP